jgi:hypothetical protein
VVSRPTGVAGSSPRRRVTRYWSNARPSILDHSPAQQRPKSVSAVKAPWRGGAPSAVAAVRETIPAHRGSDTAFPSLIAVSGVRMASVGVRSTTFRWLEFVDSSRTPPVDEGGSGRVLTG